MAAPQRRSWERQPVFSVCARDSLPFPNPFPARNSSPPLRTSVLGPLQRGLFTRRKPSLAQNLFRRMKSRIRRRDPTVNRRLQQDFLDLFLGNAVT